MGAGRALLTMETEMDNDKSTRVDNARADTGNAGGWFLVDPDWEDDSLDVDLDYDPDDEYDPNDYLGGEHFCFDSDDEGGEA